MHRSPHKYFMYIALVVVLVGLDQFTKYIAHENLRGQPPLDVLPVLQWALVLNRGAAFGFLSQAGGIQHYLFSGLAMMVSVVLLVWLWRSSPHNRLLSCGLSLVLAGAAGNLTDRLLHQYVIDFIYFHYQNWYFPAFNLADTAITFGAICLIIDSLRR